MTVQVFNLYFWTFVSNLFHLKEWREALLSTHSWALVFLTELLSTKDTCLYMEREVFPHDPDCGTNTREWKLYTEELSPSLVPPGFSKVHVFPSKNRKR